MNKRNKIKRRSLKPDVGAGAWFIMRKMREPALGKEVLRLAIGPPNLQPEQGIFNPDIYGRCSYCRRTYRDHRRFLKQCSIRALLRIPVHILIERARPVKLWNERVLKEFNEQLAESKLAARGEDGKLMA